MRQHPRSRFLKHRRQRLEFLIGPRPRKLTFSPQDPAIYAQILQNAAAQWYLMGRHLPPVFHYKGLRIVGPGVIFIAHGG